MLKRAFGKSKDGHDAALYSIANTKGMELLVTDFGATVVSIFVRDRDGQMKDVILGYDEVTPYERTSTYFGATVGRNCNRIGGAKITIDDVEYNLEANDRGNNLHSGSKGLSKVVWQVKEYLPNQITFHYDSPDLEEGYPGNAAIDVTFTVTEENDFLIEYLGMSDKKTIFNLTNHCYFNLNGHTHPDVLDHELWIMASHFTPIADSKSIPTGEILAVEGTPFDFRQAKTIGRDIKCKHEQIDYAWGYDHNYAIDKTRDGVELIAKAYSSESGIGMEVYTDCPGVQLYTANGLRAKGKEEANYGPNAGFCLETQYFPNAINEVNFASPLVEAGKTYKSTTRYHFYVE